MKKQPMYKRYQNKMPISVVNRCGDFGLVIYFPDDYDKYDCDYVCSWYNSKYEWGFHKHNIHYTPSGRAFIRKGSLRIYLDDVTICD